MRNYFTKLLLSSLLLFSTSCVRNPATGKLDFMLISEKREIAMGQEADPEIVRFFGLYEDAAMQKFISEKGHEMAAISHRPDLPYEFKIVDSPVVNAFAVPGGFVYFTRGIMAHFNNEAEFAGVLGHEIGHITARHSARQQSRQVLAQVGLLAGMVISPELAQFSGLAEQGLGLLFLKYGRNAERQSDELGVEYSTKIGYDAEEMAGFFNTLHRLSGGDEGERMPGFLSTHPHPQDRLEDVRELAEAWQQKVGATNFQVNRNQYLRLIDGMVYGQDPKQGFVENNTFYHPVLEFQFPVPAQWAVENTPQQVQMAQPDGKAVMVMGLAAEESLQAAAQGLLSRYKLKQVESRQVNVNGLPAIAMVADQGEGRQTVRTLSYLISYNNHIYNFIGASARADFDTFAPVFTNTMSNFKQLQDQEMLNRQPERIRIRTVNQRTTLAQALRGFQVPDERLEEVAVLNSLQLDDRVEQGMLIKVIER